MIDKQFHHDYGMAKGHAPIADKVVCVDFDSTLFPWGPLFNLEAEPNPGAIRAMNAFAEAGWHIVIFTSRMSRKWLADAGESRDDHYNYIKELCRKNGIPFHRILGEKIPAQAYIDDKAIEYTPSNPNWDIIQQRVLAL